MASSYHSDDYQAFIATMRAEPTDAVTPLVCADWLEEHDLKDHAEFIRLCASTDGTTQQESLRRQRRLVELISFHIHQWTAGAVRKYVGQGAYTRWPMGFLRVTSFAALEPGSDRLTNADGWCKLVHLVKRQPVHRVELYYPALPFAPPSHHARLLAQDTDMPEGIKFVWPGRGPVPGCTMWRENGKVHQAVATIPDEAHE